MTWEARLNGPVTSVLDVSGPFDAASLLTFLERRAVADIEYVEGDTYARTLLLPHGPAALRLVIRRAGVELTLWTSDPADVAAGIERVGWLLDLDRDLAAIEFHLARDPVLRGSVLAHPGLRVPGHVDGFEAAVRAIVGQQISVAGARTILGRLVASMGEACAVPGECPLTRLFPTAQRLAAADPGVLPMPRARARALITLSSAVADGGLRLTRGVDLESARSALLALPGIGPWTADYIALRALGDPDVFLSTDLGVRHGLARLGLAGAGAEAAERWRPWRSYALMHVWKSLDAGAA